MTRWLRKSYDQNIAEVYNEMKKSNDKRKKMERDYITTCNMIQTQTRLDRQISYLASKKKRYTNLLAKKKQVWLNVSTTIVQLDFQVLKTNLILVGNRSELLK